MSVPSRDFTVITACPACGNSNPAVQVNKRDYLNFSTGRVHIQRAMPYLTPTEREYFISGFCQACWDKMFGDDGG